MQKLGPIVENLAVLPVIYMQIAIGFVGAVQLA
jgi:hypothetical protein